MDRPELTRRFEEIELGRVANEKLNNLRVKFQFLAAHVDELCPDSREKTRAFNLLDDALTLCEKALARNT